MSDPDADELEKFKSTIDLRAYAAAHGWEQDAAESWRGSTVMRHPDGGKIVITRDEDGHFVYYSVRDERDHGTIIDFVQFSRPGLTLGASRKELRPWLQGNGQTPVPAFAPLHKTTKDRARIHSEYARTKDAPRHPYLEDGRCIPAGLLASPRFAGAIRIDQRGNAIFPHFDEDGLCGFEVKNSGFTSFSAGGMKGLWISNPRQEDNCLVVCESAIDCLSHAALFPNPSARYASLGGQVSTVQRELLRVEITRMPAGAEIRPAMDADDGGRALTGVVRRAFLLSRRDDLSFREDTPAGHKDWNDALRANDDDPQDSLNAGEAHPTDCLKPDGVQISPNQRRPIGGCPKCGSRQWVRTATGTEWVCYECPKPDGTRIRPNDVTQCCTIALPGDEYDRHRTPKPTLGNFVVRDDDAPVPGSGRRIPVSARDPLLPAVPTKPCPQCGHRQFWRGKEGTFTCSRCQKPPRPDSEIAEWWYVAP